MISDIDAAGGEVRAKDSGLLAELLDVVTSVLPPIVNEPPPLGMPRWMENSNPPMTWSSWRDVSIWCFGDNEPAVQVRYRVAIYWPHLMVVGSEKVRRVKTTGVVGCGRVHISPYELKNRDGLDHSLTLQDKHRWREIGQSLRLKPPPEAWWVVGEVDADYVI